MIIDLDGEKQQLVWDPSQSNPSNISTNAKLGEINESTCKRTIIKVCGKPQPLSEGQHYDQGIPMSVMNYLYDKEGKESISGQSNEKAFNRNRKVKDLTGLCHIQASVSFTNQSADKSRGGGHFLCYPHSHSEVHSKLVGGTYRATPTLSNTEMDRAWVPLTDKEIQQLSEFGCQEKRIFANVGDVILWRSDLVVSDVFCIFQIYYSLGH